MRSIEAGYTVSNKSNREKSPPGLHSSKITPEQQASIDEGWRLIQKMAAPAVENAFKPFSNSSMEYDSVLEVFSAFNEEGKKFKSMNPRIVRRNINKYWNFFKDQPEIQDAINKYKKAPFGFDGTLDINVKFLRGGRYFDLWYGENSGNKLLGIGRGSYTEDGKVVPSRVETYISHRNLSMQVENLDIPSGLHRANVLSRTVSRLGHLIPTRAGRKTPVLLSELHQLSQSPDHQQLQQAA